jgi:CHAD domain-containing protein
MPIDRNRVVEPFLKVRRSLSRMPKDPTPKQIHKLRTRMRRIEAVLDALGPVLPATRRLLREEKPFRRRLGNIRDMDVLTGLASSLKLDTEDEASIELLEHLGAERYRHTRKLRVSVRQDGQTFTRDLKRWAARLEKLVGDEATPEARAESAGVIAARALALSRQLNKYPRLSRSNLHEFRLQVKHLRYMLQMATDSETEFVSALGEAKDKIGEWHDWEQLTEVAREVAQNGSSSLIKKLTAVTRTKFTEALRLSERLRTQHLAGLPASRRARATGGSAPDVVANSLLAA